MDFRKAGASGLHVSAIAYGNFLTHGDKIDVNRARDCVQAALDEGITTFDTADSYAGGAAEEMLGQALAGVPRDSVEVCTKVFFPLAEHPLPNARGLSRKHVMESIDGSLRRLGVDYVDLYYAHRYDPETPLEEAIQAFADIVRAGKALYIGISEWPAEQIVAAAPIAARLGVPLIADQVQYSMLWRAPEQKVTEVCAQAGIGLLAWSPLAQGVLSGKYRPGEAPPADSRAAETGRGSELIRQWLGDDVLAAVQELNEAADTAGLPLARLALAWVLSRPHVASVVVGGSKPEQIRENVRASDVTLAPDLLARIETILADLADRRAAPATATA